MTARKQERRMRMPIPMRNNTLLKPYNIVYEGEDGATIDMYGEVMETRPVDWWTGQPVPGNFILLDEFLNDLKSLEGKSSVTVHINSVGGSFFAGLAIYNRLRTLGASITTINDSLAASAGSIIFMAGDKGKRKVHAGSTLMVHGVMGFLYGYYNVADLKDTINTLKAHDKTLVAAYQEATGLDVETIRAALAKDTYMTGQEAVDAGWADEVISGDGVEPVNMKLTPDKSRVMVNGHAVAACLFGKLPENIPAMTAEEYAALSTPASGAEPHNHSDQPAPQARNNTHTDGGKTMEFTTPEELRNAFPELVAQIEAAARAEGVTAERNRIQEIESIQAVIGDAQMVQDAKFGEKPMNAKDMLFGAAQKMSTVGNQMLGALQTDAAASGAANVTGAPAGDPVASGDDVKAEADNIVKLFNATKTN